MKAKTCASFCYCTQNIQQSEAGVNKISVFLLTTSPDVLFDVECFLKIRFFYAKLTVREQTKPQKKLMGHTS